MPEVICRDVTSKNTHAGLTFQRKNFINKIIIGNHSPLRRHVRVALALMGFTPKKRTDSQHPEKRLQRHFPSDGSLFVRYFLAGIENDAMVGLIHRFDQLLIISLKNYLLHGAGAFVTSRVSRAAVPLSCISFMPISPFLVDISPILCLEWQHGFSQFYKNRALA